MSPSPSPGGGAGPRGTADVEPPAVLRGTGLTVRFGGVAAVAEVDFAVARGEILGLIGPNGAGKTTMLNVLTGFQAAEGQVFLGGQDITAMPAHQRSRRGVVRTFQAVRVFKKLTVLENIEVGALAGGHSKRAASDVARGLLDGSGLGHRAETPAGDLPYGEERKVGMLRAVAAGPAFLLLDEPAAGLNDAERGDLADAVRAIRDEHGCGVVMVEHDLRLIMGLCDRIHVLDHGRTLTVGTPDEVQRDEAVIRAYIGSERKNDAA